MQFEQCAYAHSILQKTQTTRRSWFIAGNFSLREATESHTYSIISQVPGWNYFTWRIPGIL